MSMYARNFQYFFINFKYNALTAHLLTIKLDNFFFQENIHVQVHVCLVC